MFCFNVIVICMQLNLDLAKQIKEEDLFYTLFKNPNFLGDTMSSGEICWQVWPSLGKFVTLWCHPVSPLTKPSPQHFHLLPSSTQCGFLPEKVPS